MTVMFIAGFFIGSCAGCFVMALVCAANHDTAVDVAPDWPSPARRDAEDAAAFHAALND